MPAGVSKESELVNKLFAYWVTVTAKDAQRVACTPERRHALLGALRRFGETTIKLALAYGAVSRFHWENGHTDLNTLLLPPARMDRNAKACSEALPERVRWFRARFDKLKAELKAEMASCAIDQSEHSRNADIARLAALKRRIAKASLQGMALEELAALVDAQQWSLEADAVKRKDEKPKKARRAVKG